MKDPSVRDSHEISRDLRQMRHVQLTAEEWREVSRDRLPQDARVHYQRPACGTEGEVKTCAEWAKRPLVERKIAAEAWCDGWNDALDGSSEPLMTPQSANVLDHFALDCLDAPAVPDEQVGPMPWRLQIAATFAAAECPNFSVPFPLESLVWDRYFIMADALLAAEKGGA